MARLYILLACVASIDATAAEPGGDPGSCAAVGLESHGDSMAQLKFASARKIIARKIEEDTAQNALCDVLWQGELRNWKDQSQCLDVHGTDGKGNVATYRCTAEADQQWFMCADGSIRNQASWWCLDIAGHSGEGNIGTAECEFVDWRAGKIADDQRWSMDSQRHRRDHHGIQHTYFRLKSSAQKGKCLDVDGYDGKGPIATYHCEEADDQFFYITGRGEALWTGRMINMQSHDCLDVSHYDGKGNVGTSRCETDQDDQIFTFFQSGELVNKKSGWCLDVSGYSGQGDVGTHPCENKLDQKWFGKQRETDHTIYIAFSNQKNPAQCLDVSGTDGHGDVATYRCTGERDHFWRVGTGSRYRVVKVDGKWKEIGFMDLINNCVQTGVTETHGTEIATTLGTEVSMALTVGKSVTVGVEGFSGTSSFELTTTVSSTWAREERESFSVARENNEEKCLNPENFDAHFMWQWEVKAELLSHDGNKIDSTVELKVLAVTTDGSVEPKCLPHCATDYSNIWATHYNTGKSNANSYQQCHNEGPWCSPCGWLDRTRCR